MISMAMWLMGKLVELGLSDVADAEGGEVRGHRLWRVDGTERFRAITTTHIANGITARMLVHYKKRDILQLEKSREGMPLARPRKGKEI